MIVMRIRRKQGIGDALGKIAQNYERRLTRARGEPDQANAHDLDRESKLPKLASAGGEPQLEKSKIEYLMESQG